jgi:hypothetical protein
MAEQSGANPDPLLLAGERAIIMQHQIKQSDWDWVALNVGSGVFDDETGQSFQERMDANIERMVQVIVGTIIERDDNFELITDALTKARTEM